MDIQADFEYSILGGLLLYVVNPMFCCLITMDYMGKSTMMQTGGHFILSDKGEYHGY